MPDRLYFTDSDEANALIASDPMALLIGFALEIGGKMVKVFQPLARVGDPLLGLGLQHPRDPDLLALGGDRTPSRPRQIAHHGIVKHMQPRDRQAGDR